MQKIVLFLVVLFSLSYGKSLFKAVDDTTNSGIGKGSTLFESQRPNGFLINHVKDEVTFNKDGKALNKEGKIKMIRLAVNFDYDKYDIGNKYQEEIKDAINFLKKNKTLQVIVEGHTDSKGTNAYNYTLSDLRAKKVATALHNKGIRMSQITTKGFGETVPIASNKTAEGRAQNRRVEISFNKKKEK